MNAIDSRLELARLADAPAIGALSARVIEAGLVPSWPAERVAHHIRNPDSVVLVARGLAPLSGFAIMQYGETSAHLNLLAVQNTLQRRGLGRALVSWLEASAVVAGTFLIRLELRATNAGAHAFYAAQGYRDTGRVAGYYQHREDAIQMAKDLSIASPASELAAQQPARRPACETERSRQLLERLGLNRGAGRPPAAPPA